MSALPPKAAAAVATRRVPSSARCWGLSLTARSSAQAKTALARGNKDTLLQKTALCLWSHPFSDSPHYVQREEMRHDHLPA